MQHEACEQGVVTLFAVHEVTDRSWRRPVTTDMLSYMYDLREEIRIHARPRVAHNTDKLHRTVH